MTLTAVCSIEVLYTCMHAGMQRDQKFSFLVLLPALPALPADISACRRSLVRLKNMRFLRRFSIAGRSSPVAVLKKKTGIRQGCLGAGKRPGSWIGSSRAGEGSKQTHQKLGISWHDLICMSPRLPCTYRGGRGATSRNKAPFTLWDSTLPCRMVPTLVSVACESAKRELERTPFVAFCSRQRSDFLGTLQLRYP